MATVDRAVQVHTRRVFLSYKRNVEPDQTLAAEVVAGLETAGYPAFIDRRLTVGRRGPARSRQRFARPRS
jgi:hypothetical protein